MQRTTTTIKSRVVIAVALVALAAAALVGANGGWHSTPTHSANGGWHNTHVRPDGSGWH